MRSGLRSSTPVDDRRGAPASEPAQAAKANPADEARARTDLFHPAVAAWFTRAFPAPSPAQVDAWPKIKARRHTLIAAPTGSGKTLAAFLAAIDDLVRQGLEGTLDERRAGRLRLAAQGAQQRHPSQPRGAAGRHKARTRAQRVSRRRHSHAGSDRRHRGQRARPHAPQPAAHPRHDARVALRAARLRVRTPDAGDDEDRDSRRDPRGRAEQARRASRAFARTPVGPLRRPSAAHRPLGHPEPDPRSREPPDRRRR